MTSEIFESWLKPIMELAYEAAMYARSKIYGDTSDDDNEDITNEDTPETDDIRDDDADEKEISTDVEILSHLKHQDKEVLVLECAGYPAESISVTLEPPVDIRVILNENTEWGLPRKESRFFIPVKADRDNISVRYLNGALEISFPYKTVKEIPIQMC